MPQALKTGHINRVGVWGRSGSGKSSWVKNYIRGRKRIVIFDPGPEAESHGFPVVRTMAALKRAILDNWNGFRVVYIPPAGAERAALSSISWFLAEVQDACRDQKRKLQKITLVVEEMNLSFPLHGGAEKCTGFAELCSRGRARFIELIGISQRIAEVSNRFRGNNSLTVVFAQGSKADRDRAAAEISATPEQVTDLEPLEYLINDNGTVTKDKVKFRKSLK